MGRPMLPCPGCARHVRVTERACPFCGAALAFGGVAPRAAVWPRATSAAAWVFGASVAAGCAARVGPGEGADAAQVADAIAAPDATAVSDAAMPTPTLDAAMPTPRRCTEDDASVPIALYGAPPLPPCTPIACPRHPEIAYGAAASACNVSDDCVAVVHGLDCCGSRQYVGVNRAAQAAQFDPTEAQCRAAVHFDLCDCAGSPTTTQDGARVSGPDAVGVMCRAGVCLTFAR